MPDVTACYGTSFDFITFFGYFHARCDFKLWNALWFYYVFLWILHKIDEYSCLKCSIFTKHSYKVYLMWIKIFCYNKMSGVTEIYGTLLDFITFLDIFIHYWRPFLSEVLYIHQTFTDFISNQNTDFDMLTCQM